MPFDFLKESGRLRQSCKALSITPTARSLIVSIARQEMAQLFESQIERVFQISTSKNAPSCLADSYGTPIGLHAISDLIGGGQPEGMVFKGRVPTKHFSEFSNAEQANNLITSRILRLKGLEPGTNSGDGRDSYERYIYIHGTNHEDRIGQPFSGGCVEMLNAEVVQLFDSVNEGDLVWIVES
ncbi:MAG: L,D-transpeptidase [Coraliomargarita sp.]|nr:L,D-transpeptidase [Coraliomargarita sp.]